MRRLRSIISFQSEVDLKQMLSKQCHDITLLRGCLIAGLHLVCTERVEHYYKSIGWSLFYKNIVINTFNNPYVHVLRLQISTSRPNSVEAKHELLRLTLAEMIGKVSGDGNGKRSQVRSFIKLLLLFNLTIRTLTSFSLLFYQQTWGNPPPSTTAN